MDGQQPAPGWYPDPQAPGTQRYWDGQAWTQHTAPVGQNQTGPVVQGQASQRSGLSIASLVLGIVGILAVCFCPVFIIPLQVIGLSLGWMVLNRVKRGELPESERGMALAGVILNAIGLVIAVVLVLIMVLWLGGGVLFMSGLEDF